MNLDDLHIENLGEKNLKSKLPLFPFSKKYGKRIGFIFARLHENGKPLLRAFSETPVFGVQKGRLHLTFVPKTKGAYVWTAPETEWDEFQVNDRPATSPPSPGDAFRPIAHERKYLMDYKR